MNNKGADQSARIKKVNNKGADQSARIKKVNNKGADQSVLIKKVNNKGADQYVRDAQTGLRLCFSLVTKSVFLETRLII